MEIYKFLLKVNIIWFSSSRVHVVKFPYWKELSPTLKTLQLKNVRKMDLQIQPSPVPCGSLQAKPHPSISATWTRKGRTRVISDMLYTFEGLPFVGPKLKNIVPKNGIGFLYVCWGLNLSFAHGRQAPYHQTTFTTFGKSFDRKWNSCNMVSFLFFLLLFFILPET